MIASEINFDLFLCLASIGINIDSIESEICPKGLSKEFEHQNKYNNRMMTKRNPTTREVTLVHSR